jgi:hypothetical protein
MNEVEPGLLLSIFEALMEFKGSRKILCFPKMSLGELCSTFHFTTSDKSEYGFTRVLLKMQILSSAPHFVTYWWLGNISPVLSGALGATIQPSLGSQGPLWEGKALE